jgi:ABC-type transport system involved in multi-copper enzyme maturation permease subunit
MGAAGPTGAAAEQGSLMTALAAPRSAVRSSVSAMLGATRFEYLMQLRRPALWIVSVVLIVAAAEGPGRLSAHASLADLTASWAVTFNLFAPVGIGVLLADRARRESRLGLDDLLGATPSTLGQRWWGKAFGVGAATITPIALCWLVLLASLTISHGIAVVPIGLLAFIAVTLPGLIFVCACSLAVPLLTGPVLYRVGFIGYWFWGNLLNVKRLPIPTVAGTPFEAIGEYASGGWFGGKTFEAPNRGIHPDPSLAALNVAFLLVAALAAIAIAHLVLSRRRKQ